MYAMYKNLNNSKTFQAFKHQTEFEPENFHLHSLERHAQEKRALPQCFLFFSAVLFSSKINNKNAEA